MLYPDIIAAMSALFARVSHMQLSCCMRLRLFQARYWSMCQYMWTYLNPPMKVCLVVRKLRLMSTHFALGLICRRWCEDSSRAFLLLHEITAVQLLIAKNSATALARRCRHASPTISALNKLAKGDFSQKVPVIHNPESLQKIIQPTMDKSAAFFLS